MTIDPGLGFSEWDEDPQCVRKWTLIMNYPRVSGVLPLTSSNVHLLLPFSPPSLLKYIKGSSLSCRLFSQPLFLSSDNIPSRSFTLSLTPKPDYPPVSPNMQPPPGPAPEKVGEKPRAHKAKGAVRAKSGCYTCRIRRKVGAPFHHHRLSTTAHPLCRSVTSSQTLRGVAKHVSVSAFSALALVPNALNG